MIAAFKTAGFGYTFINDNAGVPETERNRKGVAGVAAQDYARQASAFFGNRPLDNPGYSKMELIGEVKVGSTNRLDVLKVEQRLKYLGYGISSLAGSAEIQVNGQLSNSELLDPQQFDQIASGKKTFQTSPKAATVSAFDLNWLNAYNAPTGCALMQKK